MRLWFPDFTYQFFHNIPRGSFCIIFVFNYFLWVINIFRFVFHWFEHAFVYFVLGLALFRYFFQFFYMVFASSWSTFFYPLLSKDWIVSVVLIWFLFLESIHCTRGTREEKFHKIFYKHHWLFVKFWYCFNRYCIFFASSYWLTGLKYYV